MPYLPAVISNSKKYTLVLDLDETLIHYIEQATCQDEEEFVGKFLVRPGA